jgi:hypothetical protein
MFAAIVLDSFSSSNSPTFTDYIHVIRALLIVRLQEVGGEHLHGKTRLSSESCQARVLVPSFQLAAGKETFCRRSTEPKISKPLIQLTGHEDPESRIFCGTAQELPLLFYLIVRRPTGEPGCLYCGLVCSCAARLEPADRALLVMPPKCMHGRYPARGS